MTDYNDGKWHDAGGLSAWPVHGESIVARVWTFAKDDDGGRYDYGSANVLHWGSEYGKTVSFRVVKAYREPREFWVNEYPNNAFGDFNTTKEDADGDAHETRIACLRLREDIE